MSRRARLLSRSALGRARRDWGTRAEETAGSLLSPCPPATVFLHGYEGSRPRVPWPAFPPPGYLGQLAPGFQANMAASRDFVTREDCDFYHTVELPSGEVIPGAWDLRGSESAYLGGVDLAGKRVLEIGPATGHLSFHLERSGAKVVCFDVGWDVSVDLLPRPDLEAATAQMDVMRYIGTTQNSWWYLHRELNSSVPIVYGNVYELPGDIGHFEAALACAILLHLRDPFSALSQVAARVSDTIVVTEPLQDKSFDPELNVMGFAPQDPKYTTHWWSLSPAAVCKMLSRLGFESHEVTYHEQIHHLDHDRTRPPVMMEMYTVVARRR